MKKHFSIIITILISAVLAISPAFAQDPSFYVKKDIWQETMLSSREALVKAEQKLGGGLLTDFGVSDFTFSAWIKTTAQQGVIFMKSQGPGKAGRDSKVLFINEGSYQEEDGSLVFWINLSEKISRRAMALAEGVSNESNVEIRDGKWHHIVLTGGAPFEFFVDGRRIVIANVGRLEEIGPDNPEHGLYLGASFPRRDGFKGDMDEVKIYGRRLSKAAVKALYEDPAAVEGGLAGWWRFEGDASDSSGNSNDGKIEKAIFTQGKYGEALRFDGKSNVAFPCRPRQAERNRIWDLIARDFSDGPSKKQQKLEKEDNIWRDEWKPGDFQELAQRYAQASKKIGGFSTRAAKLAARVRKLAELEDIRKIYHASRRDYVSYVTVREKTRLIRDEIEYLDELHTPDDARWNKYKVDADKLNASCKAVLSDLDNGEASALDKLSGLVKELSDLYDKIPLRLPSGPPSTGRFGAIYTTLKYTLKWDRLWRVGKDADIVVRFADGDHRFVFWRGANYIPNWVTPNGIWYNNQFTETWVPGVAGSFEPMSDKQCRYSHVRVVESNDARVVIHWRYALNDVYYNIAWPDEETGWGDWVDEYYVIYPDTVSVRHLTCHSSHWGDNAPRHTDDAGHEYQEGILVYNKGSLPEESAELDAVHVANMKGETAKWSWENHGHPTTPTPEGTNIAWMNVKSAMKPFVVSPEGCGIAPYEGSQGGSHFRWRDHWPTEMGPAPGRDASGKKAAHGSFFHLTKIPVYKQGQDWISKVLLHGLTPGGAGSVVPLARSWLYAPELKLSGSGYTSTGYDRTERAYHLTCAEPGQPTPASFTLAASKDSPVVNLALVINGWGSDGATLTLNGKNILQGKDFRVGHRGGFRDDDLIVWLRAESTKPIEVLLTPKGD